MSMKIGIKFIKQSYDKFSLDEPAVKYLSIESEYIVQSSCIEVSKIIFCALYNRGSILSRTLVIFISPQCP